MERATYGALHPGDWVQSADDGSVWGVRRVVRIDGRLEVVLVQGDAEWTGYPAPDMPVVVVRRADVSAEAYAFGVLANAFGDVQVIGERWS